jgi:hypothetical protein
VTLRDGTDVKKAHKAFLGIDEGRARFIAISEDVPGRRSAAKPLTRDDARSIAANFKLA